MNFCNFYPFIKLSSRLGKLATKIRKSVSLSLALIATKKRTPTLPTRNTRIKLVPRTPKSLTMSLLGSRKSTRKLPSFALEKTS